MIWLWAMEFDDEQRQAVCLIVVAQPLIKPGQVMKGRSISGIHPRLASNGSGA